MAKLSLYVFAHLPQSGLAPAGLLQLTEEGTELLASRFSYGNRYLERPDRIEVDPVSLTLRDVQAVRGVEIFPVNQLTEFGGIRDAAPDAWGRRIIEARLKAPANSLPESTYLLEAGRERVGALDVFVDPTGPRTRSAEMPSESTALGYLQEAADRIDAGETVPGRLLDLLEPGSGGARPKAAVRDHTGTLWLAKFTSRNDPFDMVTAEACTLTLAARCGMTVPQVRRLLLGNRPILMVRRFDRFWSKAGTLPSSEMALHDTRPGKDFQEGRVPFVSGLTMLGCHEFEAHRKGYADLAAAIRTYAPVERIRALSEELFTRLVFNILVSNDDDHLRNHGFVRELRLPEGWLLSPLYDVVPRPGVSKERRLTLEVGPQGKASNLDNALANHAAFTPDRKRALSLAKRVWGEVRQWKTHFEEMGAPGTLIDQIASAFRELEDIASPTLVSEIRAAKDLA